MQITNIRLKIKDLVYNDIEALQNVVNDFKEQSNTENNLFDLMQKIKIIALTQNFNVKQREHKTLIISDNENKIFFLKTIFYNN